jgi:hypothetical protein
MWSPAIYASLFMLTVITTAPLATSNPFYLTLLLSFSCYPRPLLFISALLFLSVSSYFYPCPPLFIHVLLTEIRYLWIRLSTYHVPIQVEDQLR